MNARFFGPRKRVNKTPPSIKGMQLNSFKLPRLFGVEVLLKDPISIGFFSQCIRSRFQVNVLVSHTKRQSVQIFYTSLLN